MRGKHRVVVSTKCLRYDFVLRRSLTIIRGDSATGKFSSSGDIGGRVSYPNKL